MNKRNDIQIFIMCHKVVPYGLRDDSLYTPLEVGAAIRNEHCSEFRDDCDKDNISILNPYYSEITGQYLLWKKIERGEYIGDYIGQEQYRRRLEFHQNFDFSQIFKHYDVIACKPINLEINDTFGSNVVYGQFGVCHNLEHLDTVQQIIETDFPLMLEDYNRFIKNGRKLYYSNSYILSTENYKQYSKFLFYVLNEMAKIENLTTIGDIETRVSKDVNEGKTDNRFIYQKQIFSFVAERLWTLWVQHKYNGKIFEVPYTLMENTGI